MNYDNDWYRYFGSSTMHVVGRSGSFVYGLDDPAGEPGTAQEDSEDSVREELAEDHGDDKA